MECLLLLIGFLVELVVVVVVIIGDFVVGGLGCFCV